MADLICEVAHRASRPRYCLCCTAPVRQLWYDIPKLPPNYKGDVLMGYFVLRSYTYRSVLAWFKRLRALPAYVGMEGMWD